MSGVGEKMKEKKVLLDWLHLPTTSNILNHQAIGVNGHCGTAAPI